MKQINLINYVANVMNVLSRYLYIQMNGTILQSFIHLISIICTTIFMKEMVRRRNQN